MAYVKEQWWFEPGDGRRIGWLWPEDMEAICESYYGTEHWVDRYAKDFGYSRAQVDRWKHGQAPIPKHIAQIVQMMSVLKINKLSFDPVDAPWLPVGTGANARRA